MEILESFRPMGQNDPQSVHKISYSERALYAAGKIVIFIQGGDTLSKQVMEVLSSEERPSVVDESSSIVLSVLKRESVDVHGQELSERVRRFSENGRSTKGLSGADVQYTNR